MSMVKSIDLVSARAEAMFRLSKQGHPGCIPERRIVSEADFRVVNPLQESDLHRWVAAWSRSSHHEPQAHPSYGFAMRGTSERLYAAIATTSSGSVILPFLVREIPTTASGQSWDAITPYGYGGAYLEGVVDSMWFWQQWDAWARQNQVVGLAIRSHLFSKELLHTPGSVVSPLTHVVVDLAQSVDEIWASYEGRVRTDIRRGRKLGIQITIDEGCKDLEQFHYLYMETMSAKAADPSYHFPLSRLQNLVAAMPDRVTLAHAYLNDELVASEMQLLGNQNAYYFLSGANHAARRSSANPVMKHEVIKWLHARGMKKYVLGGGMSPADGLFKYKRSFAPAGICDFEVGFHEAQTGAVSRLVEARRSQEPNWEPITCFVPPYRAPSTSSESSA